MRTGSFPTGAASPRPITQRPQHSQIVKTDRGPAVSETAEYDLAVSIRKARSRVTRPGFPWNVIEARQPS